MALATLTLIACQKDDLSTVKPSGGVKSSDNQMITSSTGLNELLPAALMNPNNLPFDEAIALLEESCNFLVGSASAGPLEMQETYFETEITTDANALISMAQRQIAKVNVSNFALSRIVNSERLIYAVDFLEQPVDVKNNVLTVGVRIFTYKDNPNYKAGGCTPFNASQYLTGFETDETMEKRYRACENIGYPRAKEYFYWRTIYSKDYDAEGRNCLNYEVYSSECYNNNPQQSLSGSIWEGYYSGLEALGQDALSSAQAQNTPYTVRDISVDNTLISGTQQYQHTIFFHFGSIAVTERKAFPALATLLELI